jgi:hypothetical protein
MAENTWKWIILILVIGGIGLVAWWLFTSGTVGGGGGGGYTFGKTECPSPENGEPGGTTRKVVVGYRLERVANSDEYGNLAFEVCDKDGNLVIIGSFCIGGECSGYINVTLEHALWVSWSGFSDAIGGKVIYKYTKTYGTAYSQSDVIWQYAVPIGTDYKACICIPANKLVKK